MYVSCVDCGLVVVALVAVVPPRLSSYAWVPHPVLTRLLVLHISPLVFSLHYALDRRAAYLYPVAQCHLSLRASRLLHVSATLSPLLSSSCAIIEAVLMSLALTPCDQEVRFTC